MLEIFGFDVTSAIAVIVAWLVGTYLAYRFIFIPIVLPWIEKAVGNVIRRILTEPTPDEVKAMEGMATIAWNWFLTAQIPTGKEETLEDGTTRPITTTPYRSLIDATTQAIFLKFKAMRGGLTTQGNAQLAESLGDGAAPFLASLAGPRKGQSTAEWVIEQALMKALEPNGILGKKLNSLANNVSQGGAEGW